MPITKPFDQHYDEYEQWFVENRYVYLSEIAAIRHFVPKTGLGVEIGVGSGQFALPLEIPIGIDPSENMLNLAQQKGIIVLKGVAEHLPFKNNIFDLALMVTTICFSDDVNIAFQEARRICIGIGGPKQSIGTNLPGKKAAKCILPIGDFLFNGRNNLPA